MAASIQTQTEMIAVIGHRALLQDRLPSYLAVLAENSYVVLSQQHVLLSATQARSLRGFDVEDEETLFAEDAPVCALELSYTPPSSSSSSSSASSSPSTAYEMFEVLRPQLDFVYASKNEWFALRDRSAFFPRETCLERTLIALKPNYSDVLYRTVHAELEAARFVVLGKTAKILKRAEAESLCSASSSEEEHEAELAAWTQDVAFFLAVERINAVEASQLLVGPSSPIEARSFAAETLRARFGGASASPATNAVFASASAASAEVQLAEFFPNAFPLERTLLLVRPEGIEHIDRVIYELQRQGFTILAERSLTLQRSQAERLYQEHSEFSYFDELVLSSTDGVSIALLLTKPSAIESLRSVVGKFQYEKHVESNDAQFLPASSLQSLAGSHVLTPGVYCSSDAAAARADIKALFPQVQDLAPPAPATASLSSQSETPAVSLPAGSVLQKVLVEGLTALCKAKPAGPEAVEWLANWLLEHNPNQPKVVEPREEISSAKPSIDVVWMLPSDAAADDDEVETKDLAAQASASGYLVLNARTLVAHAAQNDPEFGPLLYNENPSNKKPVPTSVLIAILERAIRNSQASKVLIKGFPATLEAAFEFESVVGSPVAVIDAPAQGERKSLRAEESQSIIDHYRLFRKFQTSFSAARSVIA